VSAGISFTHSMVRLAGAQENLETASLLAFREFERQFTNLASALLERMGTRQKASRWMMVHRAVFDGRSAYEVALEGDVDRLWDVIVSSFGLRSVDLELVGRTGF
jgi:hypothetical protein